MCQSSPPRSSLSILLFQFLRISSSIKRKDLGDWDWKKDCSSSFPLLLFNDDCSKRKKKKGEPKRGATRWIVHQHHHESFELKKCALSWATVYNLTLKINSSTPFHEEKFDVVKLIITNSRLWVLIWMLNICMEWLLLI